MPARAARGFRWGGPLCLFALLAVWRWVTSAGAEDGAWLERSLAVSRQWAEQGVGLLRSLGPVEDPRVASAAALLRLGLGEPIVAALFRVLGVALGALAVLGLARSRREGAHPISAWLLAASPLWVESCVRGDPHVALGAIFLSLGAVILPPAVAALALAWALGWSPWAWATLLLLPVGMLLDRERRKRAFALLASGIVLLWVLDPPAALHPTRWLAAILQQGSVAGFGSGLVPFGAARGGWPALGALHLPALGLLLWAARSWPERARRGDFAPLACVSAVALGMPSGLTYAAPLLILLPWGAREAGGALADLTHRARASRGWRPVLRALPVVLIVPLLALCAWRWTRGSDRAGAREAALLWTETNIAPRSLVACDADVAPPDSSRLIWLSLPFHSLDPTIYRAAYWPGWFGAFRGFVVSERLMGRYLAGGDTPPEVLDFYLWLKRSAAREHVVGDAPGRRLHVLELPAESSSALGEGWRARLRAGEAGGLPGGFVAALGGALIQGGHSGDGTLLLEEALAAGYRDVGIYLNLASGRIAAEKLADAGQTLEEALKAHPDSPELLYNFGLVLTRVGYWERAIQVLSRLRQHWPRSPETAYLLGLALANTGRVDGARRVLREALDLGLAGQQRQACLEQIDHLQGTTR